MPKRIIEVIHAFGHPNILASHPTTIMITKERQVTKRGDCIVAVDADKSVADLSTEFKRALRQPNAKLTVKLEVDGLKGEITAFGSPELKLNHPNDLVIRKSEFISDRTLAVKADKSSGDLSKAVVEKLKNPKQQVTLTLTVEA
ncbi:MAG TPA: DUF371 domain-containing protein [Candidatus Deferrimicrobiaceae bacterium]|nr:DUF371 domain-containing protein [Candidatus Deferrimicrobiaceae bacterium]